MRASLWNYVRGYVKIQVKGVSPAKVIRQAQSSGILFWDAEVDGEGAFTAKMTVRGYRVLREQIRPWRCKTKIVEKRGIPFILHGFRDRRMLLIGGPVCLCALWVCSMFIWETRVTGCLPDQADSVVATLEEIGVRRGVLKSSIDLRTLENEIVLNNDMVAWVGARLEGTVLILDVIGQVKPPEFVEDGTPADIVASKDAMIAQITVFEGKGLVMPGDKVRAGDLLVQGIFPPAAEGESVISDAHARAEITGRIWYMATAEVSRQTRESVRTGRTESASVIEIGGMEACEDSEFENYDAERKMIRSLDGFYLPLYLMEETRYELEERTVSRDEEEMKKQAGEAAWTKATREIPPDARIVDSATTYQQTENGLRAAVVIETLENIGMESSDAKYQIPEGQGLNGNQ